ncbi:MAG TPA: alpha/beta fold hydrolase [Thermoanaerobaculia bacterium]|nr:alpha/beta fold hydrolase [Thermoanaerobaculia bacterium]
MPTLKVNGAELFYDDRGSGPETVVFAHGLLFDGRMFDAQVAALADRFRCLRFDFRGQGRSAVTPDGYDMDTLAEDAAALIEALGAAPCHFVGLSMGGFVGLRLASRRPELLRSLAVLDSSADPEPAENLPRYRLLNTIARWLGLRVVAGRVMPIVFGRSFLRDPERREVRELWRQRIVSRDRRGITRAVRGVIYRRGVQDELPGIRVPTLILVGEEDLATPRERSEWMRAAIPGAELVVVPRAGHSAPIENPEAVTAALAELLARHPVRP